MDYKIIPYDIDSLDSEIYDEIKNTPEWNGIYKDDPILKMFIYIIKYYISLDLNNINNTFIDFFPNISNSSEVIYNLWRVGVRIAAPAVIIWLLVGMVL